MLRGLKVVAVAFSIFLFFCLMARIDFIVHRRLYDFGLEFSYEWANDYWNTYTVTFVAFSVIIGLIYWLSSNRTVQNLKFSVGLVATLNILMIGGLADILFFVVWGGGLPPDNVTWWWTPWYRIFGAWTSCMQITFATLTFFVTAALWIFLLRK